MFDVGLLVLVKVNLEEPGAIELYPDPLAHNLGRVDEVIQDGIVHSHQGTGPGSLLLLLVAFPARQEVRLG